MNNSAYKIAHQFIDSVFFVESMSKWLEKLIGDDEDE